VAQEGLFKVSIFPQFVFWQCEIVLARLEERIRIYDDLFEKWWSPKFLIS
jgi:hypothetical protein